MPHAINLTGCVYGRLTVVSRAPNDGKLVQWHCICVCGTPRIVRAQDLRRGHTKSCGCLWREHKQRGNRTHGMSKTPIYNIWKGMNARCFNSAVKSYPDYGGRGITVCERWLDFEKFYADMGDRPEGMSLDRMNVNGDYTPTNVRWAPFEIQNRNKRPYAKPRKCRCACERGGGICGDKKPRIRK